MYLEPEGWNDGLQAHALKASASVLRTQARQMDMFNPAMAAQLRKMAASLKLRAVYLKLRNKPEKNDGNK